MTMNELKIHYPFKPFNITQNWGNPNGMYASHFNDPTFKLHNGVDARPVIQLPVPDKYPVYCPVENFTVYNVSYEKGGGGNMVWMQSNEKLQMFDVKAYALIGLMHASKVLVKVGDKPKLGELLMGGDNTGFSTGIHTHLGLYRFDYNSNGVLSKIDTNEAKGSFNPALFFTGKYAVDEADVSTLISNAFRWHTYLTFG